MRTNTYNRFLNQWLFIPEVHANQFLNLDPKLTRRVHAFSQCTPGHLMWSMAEVANYQRLGSNSLSLGTYYWPRATLAAKGINYVEKADEVCAASTTGNTADIELFCRSKVFLCIDADPAGCDNFLPYKTSVVWEKSTDGGVTWFILDEGKINLTGNVILIGQSDWTAEESFQNTQFYGLIDSVRISVNTPRYVGDVVQPFARTVRSYTPEAAIGATNQHINGTPIDDYVYFALNLWNHGDIQIRDPLAENDVYISVVHMPPGSKTIPYYVKGRGINGGYLVAGEVQNSLFTDAGELAPDPRKFNTTLSPTDLATFATQRQLLTYSNLSSGLFSQWPAIQFPAHTDMNTGGTANKRVYQALFLEDADFAPNENSGKTRIFEVALATTGNIEGKIAGSLKTIDGTQAAIDDYVMVKDQDDPRQNGVYRVRGQSAGEALNWVRLTSLYSTATDDLSSVYVRVVGGKVNLGTSWIMTTPNPVIGESDIVFEQDKILGTFDQDFCVESWFKVSSFLHPGYSSLSSSFNNLWPQRIGAKMTLLETYYRRQRDSAQPYSGLRIYFQPEETETTGRVYVDFWEYATPLAAGVSVDSWDGPVFVSDVIAANTFHHVAVVRNRNTFSLYVNGVKQDSITAQQKKYNPKNLTPAQNSDLYRAKGFYGRITDITDSLSLIIRPPEFTFVPDNGPEYSANFNGAGSMILRNDNRTVNPPCEWYTQDAEFDENGDCTGFISAIGSGSALTLATWPGFPIPNRPANSHVYVINDNLYVEGGSLPKYNFLFAPTMRFPGETFKVELATTPEGQTDVYNDELLDTGNIDTDINASNPLYGMTITRIHPETNLPYTSALTIDGIPVVENMRVLVKDQINKAQNGVYIVKTDAWVRAEDLSTNEQLRRPYRALVESGFTNAGSAFVLDIDNLISSLDYQIGVTPLDFEKDTESTASGERFECYVERSICRGEGVDVADEPTVLVFARTVGPVDLAAGGFPGSAGVPLSSYDGTIITSGTQRVLVGAQTDSRQNGIYNMNAGPWTRTEDLKLSSQYRLLSAQFSGGSILISPLTGDKIGPGCSVGYRMTIDNLADFVLDSDAINVSTTPELLNKLYIPTTWTPLDDIVQLDAESSLPLISSDGQIQWDDFIPATDDLSVWRIWVKCGNTTHYSRNVIVRMASALNITQTNSVQTLPPQECIDNG